MLDFIGCGSAFNTKMGNNCAFIKKGSTLFLIDCGSTTFRKLREGEYLDNICRVFVLVTHLHPDHIGSLGDLIFYAHFVVKIDLTVLTPDVAHVSELLKLMGITRRFYRMTGLENEYRLMNEDLEMVIQAYPVQHVNEMRCFGYMIKMAGNTIFYSGDAKSIGADILEKVYEGEIQTVYQDVCSEERAAVPHMSYEALYKTIKPDFREHFFCMHLDEKFDAEKAKKDGFRVVALLEKQYD